MMLELLEWSRYETKYFSLMGLVCWAAAPAVAKDDKKQTREEKREQKKILKNKDNERNTD